jgi:hypothetical protein
MMGPGLKGCWRGRLNIMLVTAPANMVTLLRATVCGDSSSSSSSSGSSSSSSSSSSVTLV